jgi:hypothetical protein
VARETVERGVALLAVIDADRLPLPELVDRIEAVATDPHVQRTILDTAAERGVIERDGDIAHLSGRDDIERATVTRTGEYTCRRCGAGLSEARFVDPEHVTLAPSGPTGFRKVPARG